MTNSRSEELSQSSQEPLPIHEGETPPEEQVRGMAAPEDLEDHSKEEGNA